MSLLSLALKRPMFASLMDEDPWLYYPASLRHRYCVDNDEDVALALASSLLPAALLRASVEGRNDNVVGRGARGSVQRQVQKTAQTHDMECNFRVNVDIRQFRPEEVSVKLVENRVVVHAKHEEREDQHGFIQREFTRSYVLPSDVDVSKVEAKVNADGTLRITAPRVQPEKPKELFIPIQRETATATATATAKMAAPNMNTNDNSSADVTISEQH